MKYYCNLYSEEDLSVFDPKKELFYDSYLEEEDLMDKMFHIVMERCPDDYSRQYAISKWITFFGPIPESARTYVDSLPEIDFNEPFIDLVYPHTKSDQYVARIHNVDQIILQTFNQLFPDTE